MHPRIAALIGLVATAACGSTSSTGPQTTGPTPGPYAGNYATRVTLTQSACGTVTVQDNPTIVTHDTATKVVTFSHAGQTYTGSVATDGAFTTPPKQVNVNDGFLYAIALTGKFRTAAFDADATIDRSGGSGNCRFSVHWQASR